jgi:AraC family transcriptional regulator
MILQRPIGNANRPVEPMGRPLCHARLGMVTAIMDGQVKPLGVGAPEFSSAGTQWSGFLFEGHEFVVDREETGWSWHSTHVGMCSDGASVIRVSGGAGHAHCAVRPGSIFIFPRGCDHTNIRISDGGNHFLVTELDTSRLERLLSCDATRNDETLTPQLNIKDPQIVAIIGNMLAEVKAGCPAGSLYGESLSLALANYVAGRYSAKISRAETSEHGFSRTQLRGVIDYVHAHLGSDLSLVELASTINLSPRHFSRLFRKTFGTTPYRFVMSERVNEVKALLATHRLSITEIVETLGFADQSHLTNVFRKATGVTPWRYQRGR